MALPGGYIDTDPHSITPEQEDAMSYAALAERLDGLIARAELLAEVAEAARLLITEGLRLTPDGLIVREKADRSDPHYRLCTALEDAGLIPSRKAA